MKLNLLNKVWLRVAMIVAMVTTTFAGTAQAADELYKTALFGTGYNSASVSDNTSTWTATNGDFRVALTNFSNSSNYIQCGRRVYSSNATITTVAPVDKPITKVSINISRLSNANRVSSITLQISADYANWTNAGTFTKATGTQTVEILADRQAANLFYKIVVSTSGGITEWDNNFVRISQVDYYREADDPNAVKTPVISGTEEPMFNESTTVSISCETVDATILYSEDGGTTWTEYDNNARPILTKSTTIKAKATKDGMTESQIASKSFSKASEVKDVTWDLETNSHSSSSSNNVTWSTEFATMNLSKGGSTENANAHLGQSGGTYFYNGQMLQIIPIDGYTIVTIDVMVSGSNGGLTGNAWSNATATASGSKITLTPNDGTLPVSVVCTAGSETNLLNQTTESYRTITGVTVHYAPTSSPYIAVENNVLEVTSAETSGTIELVYNKVTPSEVAVEAHDANGIVTWITPSINTTTGKLVYTIAANTTTAERTAEIWVHCEKAEVTITVTQEAPVVVTIGTLGYSTLYYSELNLVVPEGVTAYTYKTGTATKPEISTTYYEGDVIPAGEAVVLKTDTPPSAATQYPFVVASSCENDLDGDNILKGTDVKAMTVGEGDCKFYALSHKGGKNVGFYWMAENGGAFECPAHKAYVAVPNSSGVKSFYAFDDEDDPTGIEDVNVNLNDNEEIYDLSGRRLNKMQKGINIINGKKILK